MTKEQKAMLQAIPLSYERMAQESKRHGAALPAWIDLQESERAIFTFAFVEGATYACNELVALSKKRLNPDNDL